jgi:hypothetical protein
MRIWTLEKGLMLAFAMFISAFFASSVAGDESGTVYFSKITGSVAPGCVKDFKVLRSGVLMVSTQGGIFNVFLFDQASEEGKTYSLAITTRGISSLQVGQKIGFTKFVPGQNIVEFNCYLTQPLTDWLGTGEFVVDAISGGQISYHLSLEFKPGTVNKSNSSTFSLRFKGTSPFLKH